MLLRFVLRGAGALAMLASMLRMSVPLSVLTLVFVFATAACGDDAGVGIPPSRSLAPPAAQPAAGATTAAEPSVVRDDPALAAVRAAFIATFQSQSYRVHTIGVFTPAGHDPAHMDITTEHVQPDRMHLRVSAEGAPPTELIRIGAHSWMGLPDGSGRMIQVPDGTAPTPPAAHELMLRALEDGNLTAETVAAVEREGRTYDAYRLTGSIQVPTGAMNGSGMVLVDPSNHHIASIESDFAGPDNRFQSQHTIEVDADIHIEPPEPLDAPAAVPPQLPSSRHDQPPG